METEPLLTVTSYPSLKEVYIHQRRFKGLGSIKIRGTFPLSQLPTVALLLHREEADPKTQDPQ